MLTSKGYRQDGKSVIRMTEDPSGFSGHHLDILS
jgi:hypothetical protein